MINEEMRLLAGNLCYPKGTNAFFKTYLNILNIYKFHDLNVPGREELQSTLSQVRQFPVLFVSTRQFTLRRYHLQVSTHVYSMCQFTLRRYHLQVSTHTYCLLIYQPSRPTTQHFIDMSCLLIQI